MNYRVLETVAEIEQAVALEIAVWGLDPRDAVPVNLMRALQHGGGALIGAYDADRMVGIALAFPARSAGGWILWSHMTGIHRDYQGRGIGFALKHRQREWALANAFNEIRWTFDPLQRGNANFNLRRLGAYAYSYHNNFYGVMADAINQADIPSDRVEAVWILNTPQRTPTDSTNRPFLLKDNGLPTFTPIDETQPEYLAQIPHTIPLDSSNLSKWRFALREALTTAFECGYRAVDFTDANAYVLRRS